MMIKHHTIPTPFNAPVQYLFSSRFTCYPFKVAVRESIDDDSLENTLVSQLLYLGWFEVEHFT